MDNKELHSYIAEHQDNICGIAAMKNGEIVYSDYWHGFKPSDTVHVMSVTKSVVSLLIGIAIDQGLISDVRQHVLDFFPEYNIKRGEKTIQQVTLEHLLTMTAPYKYRSEPCLLYTSGRPAPDSLRRPQRADRHPPGYLAYPEAPPAQNPGYDYWLM